MLFVKVDHDVNGFSKTNCTPKKCAGDCNKYNDTIKNQKSTEKNS